MANLKEIRIRISSVKSTMQITSAMKMVSAAKLRKAQDAIIQLRPYANKLSQILSNLTSNLEDSSENLYGQEREVKKALLILITSNKGLCGAFNANVVKHTVKLIGESYKELYDNDKVDIIAIGKKGGELLKTKGLKVSAKNTELLDDLSFEVASDYASKIMESFVSGEYDKITLVYNQFKNAGVQILTEEPFLPIPKIIDKESDKENANLDYILEPTRKDIINDLIPKSLKTQFFKALLDSVASEHGARMTAMHKATDNASDLIKSLQLEYNKARQASITKEILEIVGGAEALKG